MIWLDGAASPALPLPDRGLDFGDGLFETLLLRRGQVLFAERHFERLERGLQVLGFPACLQRVKEQLEAAAAAIALRGWHWTALRLTLTRGAGPRGYAPPPQPQPRILLAAGELDRDCTQMLPAASLSLASIAWSTQPVLAGIKHLNRLEQVLAAREYSAAGSDEAVMLDQAGQVVSVVAGNVFALAGDRLLTPPLRACGIRGTRRDLVLQAWAPALGVPVAECALSVRDLEAADEVFYCNALLGVRPVARFGDRVWRRHPLCHALHEQYGRALP